MSASTNVGKRLMLLIICPTLACTPDSKDIRNSEAALKVQKMILWNWMHYTVDSQHVNYNQLVATKSGKGR